MRSDKHRLSGFYWVRFEGQTIVAEYTANGLPCSPERPHWHVPQAAGCFTDKQVCELLSGRLEAPVKVAAGLTKEQYEFLEAFGLHRIENEYVNVERLRKAVHAAVLIIPFRSVKGMEQYAEVVSAAL